MSIIAQIAVLAVAALHFGFLVLEMVYWDKPEGRRIFETSESFARESKALAANQGLYNGFLALGLVWSAFPIGLSGDGRILATFFLWCVIIAGFYGAASVNQRILMVQSLPGLVALIAVWAL